VAFLFSRKESPIHMNIQLNSRLSSNSQVDPVDVKQVKKALNKLGYYTPYTKAGITGLPDAKLFEAITKFQTDKGLKATGTIAPNDKTVEALNASANEPQSGQYIWRTVGDDKVRENHAVLEGTTRDWEDSPDPGDDINCRCWAEKVEEEGLSQVVISNTTQSSYKWTDRDFKNHLEQGKGKSVTLQEIGYLLDVIDASRENLFKKLEQQVAKVVRETVEGSFEYNTENSYPWLKEVTWVFGSGTIRTFTKGEIEKNGNILTVKAIVDYEYYDDFTDPLNVREKVFPRDSDRQQAPEWWVKFTDLYNDAFIISGKWQTLLTGTVFLNSTSENN
jgi:peptidoglycan hydrolase-like protein with peptidoglycan-binding domain